MLEEQPIEKTTKPYYRFLEAGGLLPADPRSGLCTRAEKERTAGQFIPDFRIRVKI